MSTSPPIDKPLHIWVTRPEIHAGRTAAGITSKGYIPITEPLMHYEWLPFDHETLLQPFSAILVTSQAVFHHPDITLFFDSCKHVPIYCVGERTSELAQQAGFKYILTANGNAENLTTLYLRDFGSLPDPQTVLFLTGDPRKDTVAQNLSQMHHQLRTITLYKSLYVNTMPDNVASLWKQGKLAGVLLYSPKAAECFLDCMPNIPETVLQKYRPPIYCLSQHIADIVHKTGFDIFAAQRQTDQNVIALLPPRNLW